MGAALREVLEKTGVMVIDGSMSTALERLGARLGGRLWTAQVLAEKPALVRQVHTDYFRAGADCAITCSYQATIPGLTESGYSRREAEALIRRSVDLCLEAREDWWQQEGEAAGRAWPLCLAGIGPYGAYLADGSEYSGRYGVSDQALYDFHARRMELLREAGADLLLLETQPSLREALIEARIAEELGAAYWISFSCRDGLHTCGGDRLRDCAAAFSGGFPGLRMLGVNCTAPEHVEALIGELKSATALPIGVYPNSGQVYDPVMKRWSGAGAGDFGQYALRYMAAGAAAVGGCCTTDRAHIRQVVRARELFLSPDRAPRIRR